MTTKKKSTRKKPETVKAGRGRPPVCDWDSIPFNKVGSDAELALALGCSPETVRNQRRKRGY
jgi:hypothetical protein